MAFTGNFMCTSFKQELLTGSHNFTNSTGDTFKLALYDNNASFTAATTDYTATNEVGNSGSYTAGGGTLTRNPNNFWDHGVHRLCGFDVYVSYNHCSWCVDLQHHNGRRHRYNGFGCCSGLWFRQVFYCWGLPNCVPNG
jgi:hypothetical protein